ncbi:MAG: sigma-70 family RNA polymerase sigma factor [Flavobacteriales bacterium]|nr:sigma-70 family RNA polymerase sigma factor [Flavobacteriales bacterium]
MDVLEDLKGENNGAFGELYKKYFYMVNRFVTNNNGNTNDAEDIFQDAMIVLLEKLRHDNFELTASLKTYIMAISKNIWLKKLRKNYTEVDFTEQNSNAFFEEIDSAIESEKNYFDKLQNYIHKITKHCQGLIHDMFFKEKSIEQIQIEYGYSTIHNAQNQKHKCVEQIRKVKEQDKN